MYRQNYPDHPGMHSDTTNVRYIRNPTFCERLQSSLMAVVFGGAIIISAMILLFWNEGRAVTTAKSLEEGLNIVVDLPNAEMVNEYNYGKLIHLVGDLKTGTLLNDPQYGISMPVVKLKRNAEMYQWVERERVTKVNEGDTVREETSYDYTMEWRSELISSNSFASLNYKNPDNMPINSLDLTSKIVQVGLFYLSETLVYSIKNWKKLPLPDVPKIDQSVVIHDVYYFYHGKNPRHPQIGDVRVSFEYAGLTEVSRYGDPDKVSIIAKQMHGQLGPYQTDAGDSLELLYMGEYTAEKMISNEQLQNVMLTWALRFAGWLMMFIGCNCMTQILYTLVDWIPIVRTLVALGTLAISTSFSISVSLIVIALGWIRYRPWLGITLLLCSTLPFVFHKLRQIRQQSQYRGSHRNFYD